MSGARDCKESLKRIRMKLKNSERMDRAREQMRQKARELKKKGAELKDKAAANSTLQRLRDKMKRKEEEEEARKMGPSQEEIDFNDRMYYDFMKAQKEAARRQEMEDEKGEKSCRFDHGACLEVLAAPRQKGVKMAKKIKSTFFPPRINRVLPPCFIGHNFLFIIINFGASFY